MPHQKAPAGGPGQRQGGTAVSILPAIAWPGCRKSTRIHVVQRPEMAGEAVLCLGACDGIA